MKKRHTSSYPLITFLQPSLNSNSSLLLNSEQKPGQSTPQASTPITKTVTNMKSFPNTKPNEINNNTNSAKSIPVVHQQTVRFTDQKNGKSKLRSSIFVAKSEKSIVSDAKFTAGGSHRVGMMMIFGFLRVLHKFSIIFQLFFFSLLCNYLFFISNNITHYTKLIPIPF